MDYKHNNKYLDAERCAEIARRLAAYTECAEDNIIIMHHNSNDNYFFGGCWVENAYPAGENESRGGIVIIVTMGKGPANALQGIFCRPGPDAVLRDMYDAFAWLMGHEYAHVKLHLQRKCHDDQQLRVAADRALAWWQKEASDSK